VQTKIKKMALTAVALIVVAGIALAASGKLPTAGSSTAPVVIEDVDTVKRSIAEQFEASPSTFVQATAVRRLANARLDGFAVCTLTDEATAAQYVEVAAMIDKATKHTAEFMKVVDGVMGSVLGMSDCDYRVISLLSRVATHD
jgi:hypothetical protein